MGKHKKIEECPHCGCAEGIFTRSDYIGVPYCIGFGGEEQDNTLMYDNTESIRGGRIAYCQVCGKAICRMSTLKKQWRGGGC